MTDIVADTLRKWRQSQFIWGKSDCLLSIADYVAACGHPDYGVPFRDQYDTQEGAHAQIEAAGGELAIMRRTGFTVTDEPLRGDIMLIQMTTHRIAALCTGDAAAVRLTRGVGQIDLRFVSLIEAWKVPPCHL